MVISFLSSASECGDKLRKWLCENVAPCAEKYSSSLQALILERLSLFFQRTYCPFTSDVSIALASYRAKVQAAPRAIDALLRFSPRPSVEAQAPEFHSMDDILASGLIKVKVSQRKRKQARIHAGPAFDPAVLDLFRTLGINPPDSAVDVSTNIVAVISEQLDILKVLLALSFVKEKLISLQFYLDILGDSKFEDFIRKRYISIESLEEGVVEFSETTKPSPVKDENSELKTPAAFPMVQPMKACVPLLRVLVDFKPSPPRALYFESAEGFGEWRILISSRADRDLREARRGDAKHFKNIIKKIKYVY